MRHHPPQRIQRWAAANLDKIEQQLPPEPAPTAVHDAILAAPIANS
jgi:hypothetical protein